MAKTNEQLILELKTKGITLTKGQLKQLDGTVGNTTKSFGLMAAGVAGATAALFAMGKATSFAIRVGKEFEQGMANVKAISGATGQEFKALEQNAKLLGRTTKFTATEVSGLQTEFAKLGFTSSEITKVTEGTLALAAATGSDLAISAAVAGETLRGFGLDTAETGRVTDVMAKSFSSSALDMDKFTNSMQYVAPISKMAGVSLEGTTAILGRLANAGISGSMAGTSLRKILLEAGKEGSKLAKRMGGPIKSFEDFQKKLKNLRKSGFDPLIEGEDLVGARAITAFGILLDGADDINVLNKAFENAGGSAQHMAEIQLDTLEGKMTIMKSATEGLGIAMFEHLSPGLEQVVDTMTELISKTTDWLEIDASTKMREEQFELNALVSVLQTYNNDEETRKGIIKEIQKDYPAFIENIDLEKASTKEIADELERYNKQLDKKIKTLAQEEILGDFTKRMGEYQKSIIDTTIEVEKLQIANEGGWNANNEYSGAVNQSEIAVRTAEETLAKYKEKLAEVKLEMAEYKAFMDQLFPESEENDESNNVPGGINNEQLEDQKNKIQNLSGFWKSFTKEQKALLKNQTANFKKEITIMGSVFPEMEAASKRLAQVQATVDMWASATAAYKSMVGIPVVGPALAVAAAASAVGAGLANIQKIEQAETGMDQIVNKPTLILAGEGNKSEHIGITPLEGPNIDGPQGSATSITLNISAPLIDETIVDTIIPAINEAVRRGETFATG